MKTSLRSANVWAPIAIALSLCLGLWFGSKFLGRIPSHQGLGYEKLDALISLIQNDYVDEVNIDSLLERSLSDMLAQLDPHSTYIPASELQALNEELSGSFSGIGISFNNLTDTITVLEVIPGGPSEKVGLMAGDRIISINDTIVAGQQWTNEKIMSNLRGEAGTKVKLGIKRSNSPKLLEYTVTRGAIPITSVDASYMLTDNTGYIKVNRFSENTYSEFLTALVELRNQGASKYVIDLRGNGGGYMEIAQAMANEFLPAGMTIVSTKGRIDQANSTSISNGLGAFQNEDIAILIDEISASASEILAGAIQDNDRGLVIGRRSFGKGLVQQQFDLPGNSAVRLTVGRYYTPSGRCIQRSYTPGSINSYFNDIADRFARGESYSADSIRMDKSQIFYTLGGREVYGGGGIMPDVFVPNDTLGITDYYINVFNAGMLQKYAFKYTDQHRDRLQLSMSIDELMQMLPSDDALLQDFVNYSKVEGKIAPRWYYINLSRDLIVSQLKALIARDILGTSSYYEVINTSDATVNRAIKELNNQ